MKVLHIIGGGANGGAEKFFVRLVLALQKAGLQQAVITKPIPQWRDCFDKATIPHYEASFPKWFAWKTKATINKATKEFQPDIVLTWMSRASDLCPKGDYVLVSRLGGYYKLKNYAKSDYLIGNTQDIVDYFHKNNWDKAKTCYLPNFVDLPGKSDPAKREDLQTPNDVPLIFALGRLHPNKGFDVLIKAITAVPKAHLWLAGEGPSEAELRKLAENLGLSERIHFLGWQKDPTPFFKAADIFVCPSRHEPLGNVVLEGWVHDIPVVATASEGPSILIKDNFNGLLTKLNDEYDLSGAINKLISDTELRKVLRKNAIDTYEKNFSQSIVIKKYLEFFQKILKNNENI